MRERTPRFTVIIPCKNRAEFLGHTLRTCMMQTYDRLEIIVSDDGSTENNREVVEAATRLDPRIRLVTHNPGIGMRDNFETALREVKEGFVIAIGGDDAILPDGIQGMCDVLHETKQEMLAWPAPVYTYPGVRTTNGQLMIYHSLGARTIDSNEFLRRQADNLDYLSDIESPMFYVKGVVSTALVERARRRSSDGRFYSCPTPDGYSGIVLAGETPQYAFSSRPFSLHGVSPESQGLAHISNGEKAKESSAAFLRSVASRPMHPDLASQPYSPLITLMTVDYLLTARDLPGWPGTIPPIDYRTVLLRALSELAHGMFGAERVARELSILDVIAAHHGLGEFFRAQVARSTRHKPRAPFEGTGINASVWFVDAGTYRLRNVVDAAYATKYLYQAYVDLQPSRVIKAVARSARYRLAALGRGDSFPPPREWALERTNTGDSSRG